jgi:hypothetical protein
MNAKKTGSQKQAEKQKLSIRTAIELPQKENDDGYLSLGYLGTTSVIFSYSRQGVIKLDSKSVTRRAELEACLGMEFILRRYGIYETNENMHRILKDINWGECSSDIIASCSKIGIYNPLREKGAGVWSDGDGGLIINGDNKSCYLLAKCEHELKPVARAITGRHEIYVPDHIGNWYLKPSSGDQQIHRMILLELGQWTWENEIDKYFIFGWIIMAPWLGALAWRPHIWVVGKRGSGKTTLINFIKSCLDASYCRSSDDGRNSSEAGIRQALGTSARPIILDEAEDAGVDAGGGKGAMQKILTLARSASASRGGALKGTADQTGRQFAVATSFLFASISEPNLDPGDKTRIVTCTAGPLRPDQNHPPKSLSSADCSSAMNQSLRLYPHFIMTLEAIRPNISGDARAKDTLGVLLAAALTAYAGKALTAELANAVMNTLGIDMDRHLEVQNESHDEADALQELLGLTLQIEIVEEAHSGTRVSRLSQTVYLAAIAAASETGKGRGKNGGECGAALKRCGMTARQKDGVAQLFIAANSGELKGLLRKTSSRWASGGWSPILSRVDGAEPGKGDVGAGRVRGVWVPIPSLPVETAIASRSGSVDSVGSSVVRMPLQQGIRGAKYDPH